MVYECSKRRSDEHKSSEDGAYCSDTQLPKEFLARAEARRKPEAAKRMRSGHLLRHHVGNLVRPVKVNHAGEYEQDTDTEEY